MFFMFCTFAFILKSMHTFCSKKKKTVLQEFCVGHSGCSCWYLRVGPLNWWTILLTHLLNSYLPGSLCTMQEMWVWSLGLEDPLEKEMATHYSSLVWKIPWTEEAGGYIQSIGLQRVGHDCDSTSSVPNLVILYCIKGNLVCCSISFLLNTQLS